MLDEILDLLGQRWDRIHGAQALKLLPKETKLQVLYFLDYLQFISQNALLICHMFQDDREIFSKFCILVWRRPAKWQETCINIFCSVFTMFPSGN